MVLLHILISLITYGASVNQRYAGFSLLELLICISILSLSLHMLIPNFHHGLRERQARDSLQTLQDTIELARSQAISSHRHVMLCSSSDGLQCNGSKDWSSGYVLRFISTDTDQQADPGQVHGDASPQRGSLLASVPALQQSARLVSNRSELRFNPLGFSPSGNQSFRYTLQRNGHSSIQKMLIINLQGRVRLH